MDGKGRDIRQDLEHLETKKLMLFYLYLYHDNYKNEDNVTKREIRTYYEERLRYKGAFYRDKKAFEKFGSPMEWTDYKVKSYKLKEDKEEKYFSGMTTFQSFIYPSTHLIEILLMKSVRYILIEISQEGMYIINEGSLKSIKNDIKDLVRKMSRIDTANNKIKIRKSSTKYQHIDLDNLKVVFKLVVNDYIRYISTKFVPRKLLLTSAEDVLLEFLRTITGLESKDFSDYNPSTEFEENFKLKRCILERIDLVKYSNMFNAQAQGIYFSDCEVETNTLRSIEIMQVL